MTEHSKSDSLPLWSVTAGETGWIVSCARVAALLWPRCHRLQTQLCLGLSPKQAMSLRSNYSHPEELLLKADNKRARTGDRGLSGTVSALCEFSAHNNTKQQEVEHMS